MSTPPCGSGPGQPPHIVVVGSINMDVVACVGRLPRPGETVCGRQLLQTPGGKGANQAVAAARLGARVTMIGRVGDDAFAGQLVAALAAAGVDTHHVARTENCSSGVALIGVEDSGENAIIIVAGANGQVTFEDVEQAESVIGSADALLLQLEIPLDAVEAAVTVARRHGVMTVLDPAPVPQTALPDSLYCVDVLSPNQSEAEALSGLPVPGPEQAAEAAAVMLQRGARQVVVKLGAAGALLAGGGGKAERVAAPVVQAVDTTAAGDAFTAALAVGQSAGMRAAEAVRFACAAGALATTRLGAQQAMPSRSEVERLLASLAAGQQ